MIRVEADIRYLDGNLSDIEIPSGFHITVPDYSSAAGFVKWIEHTRKDNDFVRALGTGDRYIFTSPARSFELKPIEIHV